MKRLLILVILTGITSAAVLALRYTEPLRNEKLFSFPLQIGKWSGQVIPMQNWVFDSLETRYAIMRDYRSPSGAVNIAITWYDDKEVAFHAPDSCLGGVGNEVKKKTVDTVRLPDSQETEIGKLVVEKNGRRSLACYYFISDGYITEDQNKVRALIMFKRLQFRRTSAGLVRLMTPVVVNEERSYAVLREFLEASLKHVIEYTSTPSAM